MLNWNPIAYGSTFQLSLFVYDHIQFWYHLYNKNMKAYLLIRIYYFQPIVQKDMKTFTTIVKPTFLEQMHFSAIICFDFPLFWKKSMGILVKHCFFNHRFIREYLSRISAETDSIWCKRQTSDENEWVTKNQWWHYVFAEMMTITYYTGSTRDSHNLH